MNTIATFFAGVIVFFSGLFGNHTVSAPVISPQQLVASSSVAISPTNVEASSSQVSNVLAKSEASSTFLYKNEKYGFTLSFPSSWKGYKVNEKNYTDAVIFSFGVGEQFPVLDISIYTRKQWLEANRLVEEEGDKVLPAILIQNSSYVFVSEAPQDVVVFPSGSSRESILSTLTLYGSSDVEKAWKKVSDFYQDYNGNVYYYNGTQVKGVDQATFISLGNGFAKDKNSVYYLSIVPGVMTSYKKLEGADQSSFKIKGDTDGTSWIPVDSKHVFTWHKDHFVILTDADPATIHEIDRCARIDDIGSAPGEDGYLSYFSDGHHIFPDLESSVIDFNTFKVYTKSNKSLFEVDSDEPIIGEWKYLGLVGYAHDKNNVYVGCGTKIEGVDKTTFEVLDFGYSKDQYHVYYLNKLVDGADPKSFKPIPPSTLGKLK
jgi:hypothetical protein